MGMKNIARYSPYIKYAAPFAAKMVSNLASKIGGPKRLMYSKTVPLVGRPFSKPPPKAPTRKVRRKVPVRRNLKTKYKKRYKRYRRKSNSSTDNYLVDGYVLQLENASTVTDPDVVGITHSTFSLDSYALTLCNVIIRKLLNKIGYNPPTTQEALGLPGLPNIILYYKDNNNSTQSVTYLAIPSSESISGIAQTFFSIVRTGFTTSGTVRLTEIHYACGDCFRSILNLEDMVVKIHSTSKLKLQNRTTSDGASLQIEQVDNNPVEGYRILCKGAVPQTNTVVSVPAIENVSNIGIATLQGATLGSFDREPFRKSNITNAYYEKYMKIGPGSIYTSTLHHYQSGYLNNIIKGSHAQVNGTSTVIKAGVGKCEVVMLQEIINSGTSVNINIAYEQEITLRMKLILGKKRAIRIDHRVNTS